MDEKLKACGLDIKCTYEDIKDYCRGLPAAENFAYLEISYWLVEHDRYELVLFPQPKDWRIHRLGDGFPNCFRIGRTQEPFVHEGVVKAGRILYWQLRKDFPEIQFKRNFSEIAKADWATDCLRE